MSAGKLAASPTTRGARRLGLFIASAVFTAAVCLPAASAHAQAGRLFLAVPVDSNLVIATYNGARSNTWADGTIPDAGVTTRTQTTSVVYSRIMNVFGHTGGPGISLPYADMLGYQSSGQVIQDTRGFADPALTFDVNFFGAPAMTAEQFRNFVPVTYSGLHLTLGTPWGQYSPSASTNLGSNRWSLKTLINYSITHDGGATWLDFYPSVRVYGNNDAYQGTQRLSQRPSYGLEAHWSTTLATRTWASVGLIGSAGGAVEVDGVRTSDAQNALRLALGAGFPIWPGGTGILAWNRTVWRSDAVAQSTNFMLQLIHKF
jgi:hypothetical protein